MKKKILILCPKFYPSLWWVEEQVRLLGECYVSWWYAVDIYTTKHHDDLAEYEELYRLAVYRFSSLWGLLRLLCMHRKEYCMILSRHYYKNSFVLSLTKLFAIIQTKTIICADSGWDHDEIVKIQKKWWCLHAFYFRCIQHNDYLNCINQDNRNHLEAIIGKSKKIVTIYNGIAFWTQQYPKRTTIKNILFLSRLIQEKWVYETIAAFMRLSDHSLRLTIAGSWSVYDEELVKKTIACDARIRYAWPVYGSEKEALLLASDLLVFPSYTEGQSVLLLEAVHYNIPVITTDVSDNMLLYWKQFLYVKKQSVDDLYDVLLFITQYTENFSYDYTSIKQKLSIATTCKKFLALAPSCL